VSSSRTTFTSACPGVRLRSTSWPSALTCTRWISACTTGSATSASSSATRTSRRDSRMFASVNRPLPRRRWTVAERRWLSDSNMGGPAKRGKRRIVSGFRIGHRPPGGLPGRARRRAARGRDRAGRARGERRHALAETAGLRIPNPGVSCDTAPMLIPLLALLAIALYLAAAGLLARPLLGGGEPLSRSADAAATLAVLAHAGVQLGMHRGTLDLHFFAALSLV